MGRRAFATQMNKIEKRIQRLTTYQNNYRNSRLSEDLYWRLKEDYMKKTARF